VREREIVGMCGVFVRDTKSKIKPTVLWLKRRFHPIKTKERNWKKEEGLL